MESECSTEKWRAGWITCGWQKDTAPLIQNHLAFRRDYFLESFPENATIKIAASMKYTLWINGEFIAFGPARSYPKEQIFDEIDVKECLRPGKNEFAVLVHQPSGVTGYSLIHRMGLFIQGKIECKNQMIDVLTDTTWKVRNADWYVSTPFLFTLPLGKQEHYDAAKEPDNWKTDCTDYGWKEAFCLGGYGTPPWKQLRKSITRKPVILPYIPLLIWQGKVNRKMSDVCKVNLAQELELSEIIGSRIEAVRAESYIYTNSENIFVFDFEKTSYAFLNLEIDQLDGDVRLELFYDIKFQEYPHSLPAFGEEYEGYCDSFHPSCKVKKWKSLLPRGLRFLTVKVSGPGQCGFRVFSEIVEYDYDRLNHFSSDQNLWNDIWNTSKTTLLTATTDVIAEPFRENVLWAFDACIGGKAAYYTFGDTKMWKHCLWLIANGIDEDGIPSAVVPSSYSFMILFDQVFYWVHSCKEYYMLTNDRQFVRKILPAANRLLQLCQKHITKDGLFELPDYAWHWIDWAMLNKNPYSMPINAMLLMAAQAVSFLEMELELKSTVAQELVELLKKSLMKFYDEKQQAFCSCLPAKIKQRNQNSINCSYNVHFDLHSNALAYLTGIGTLEQRRGAVMKMLKILRNYSNETVPVLPNAGAFGIAWSQIIMEPLAEEGYVEEAIRYITEYYKPFLDAGAVTWGEDFTPTQYNTAHGWGACINSFIIESLCGIHPEKAGWESVKFKPRLPHTWNIQYCFQTVSGKIEYLFTDGKLVVNVPENIRVRTEI